MYTSYNIEYEVKSVCAFAPTEPTGCEVGRVGVVACPLEFPAVTVMYMLCLC